MDLHFTVSSLEAESVPILQVGVSESGLVISGFSNGRKIVFQGDFQNISFKLEAGQSQSLHSDLSVEQVSSCQESEPVPPVAEASESPVDTEKSVKPLPVLFQKLSDLRKLIASEERKQAYIIFHDSTLHEMCQRLPSNLEELKSISGVGQLKLEKYGSRFLEIVKEHVMLYGRAHYED